MPSRGKGKAKDKGKRNQRKGKSIENATSTFIFPRNVIINILSRLPVKSLLRFRCVCKPWRSLISNPRFIATHLDIASQNPTFNSSLLIHSCHSQSTDHIISLINTHSADPPLNLENPFPYIFAQMELVGHCNGIVCLCKPPWGDIMTLWNPATRLSKGIRVSGTKPVPSLHSKVSVGFGFDQVSNDYKIISIFCFRPEIGIRDCVEVYSANGDAWKQLKFGMPFQVSGNSCAVVVKGLPYWIANWVEEFGSRDVLVWFDVEKEEFCQAPLPETDLNCGLLVDLKDSLAAVVYSLGGEWGQCFDVWTMDDECEWSKKFSIGPVLWNANLMGSTRNGVIVVLDAEKNVFFYNPETKVVEKVLIDGAPLSFFSACSYVESLGFIKGMRPLQKLPGEDVIRELMNSGDLRRNCWEIVNYITQSEDFYNIVLTGFHVKVY